jgi:peptidoglycan/LPS O-acetylase OafA/YrhL
MKRNFAIDAARGLLALAIVLVHVLWVSGLTKSGSRQAIGWWAVYGFMVLAGYSSIAFYQPEPYGRYLTKKFFRIVPVLLVALAASHVVHTVLVPAWFITVLAQFYLVFPAIMWALARFGRKVLLWLFVVSLFCLLPSIWDVMEGIAPMGELLPMNLFWFVSGMILCYLADPYVMADLSAAADSRFPVLVRLGELSYSIYLVHWPVLILTSYLVPNDWPIAARMANLAVLGVPATLAASVLCYRRIELPGIALGRGGLLASFFMIPPPHHTTPK